MYVGNIYTLYTVLLVLLNLGVNLVGVFPDLFIDVVQLCDVVLHVEIRKKPLDTVYSKCFVDFFCAHFSKLRESVVVVSFELVAEALPHAGTREISLEVDHSPLRHRPLDVHLLVVLREYRLEGVEASL